MAKKCTRCSAPQSVCVCGYTRKGAKRRKKRKARKAPTGRYWVCESSGGRTCGVHHRTMSAAYNHVRKLRRKARERFSYLHGHKPRSRRPERTDWHVAPRGF